MRCKHCGSDSLVKSGFIGDRQRYVCKDCLRTSREGDQREKYSLEKRFRVVKMYIEGTRICDIERLEKVSNALIIHWIRKAHDIVREKILCARIPQDLNNLDIIRVDNLKKHIATKYGHHNSALLIVGNDVRLLTWEKNKKR